MPDRPGAEAPPDTMPTMDALLAAGAAARAVSTPPAEPAPDDPEAAGSRDEPAQPPACDQRDAA